MGVRERSRKGLGKRERGHQLARLPLQPQELSPSHWRPAGGAHLLGCQKVWAFILHFLPGVLDPRHGGSFVTLAQHKHITRKSSQWREKTADTVGMPGVDARGHLGMSDAGEGGGTLTASATPLG